MLLDFGLLRIASGESWSSGRDDEKALVLISGSAELIWPGEGGDSTGAAARARATRRSVLDEPPSVLHLSEGSEARIVRMVFDNSNAPKAMLVLGEVVAAPGRWSSYPPHRHPHGHAPLPGQTAFMEQLSNKACHLCLNRIIRLT
jgi:5-deoxy-D-glucuronate isomerase